MQDALLAILFELILVTVCGFGGTYLLWLFKKEKPYGQLLEKYGYAVGIGLACILTLMFFAFFGEPVQ